MKPKYDAIYKTDTGYVVKRRVNKPTRCSTPRRICINCKVNRISKNDSRYDSKVCKLCSDLVNTEVADVIS